MKAIQIDGQWYVVKRVTKRTATPRYRRRIRDRAEYNSETVNSYFCIFADGKPRFTIKRSLAQQFASLEMVRQYFGEIKAE